MQIQIDTREHKSEVQRIESQLDALGIKHYRSKLYVGDYMNLDNPRLVVDRKKDLQELCQNVTRQHERFRHELQRAQEQDIHIIILCEHGEDIKCLEDVFFWENPRRKLYQWRMVNGQPRRIKVDPKKLALSGKQLYKSLNTIAKRYNVKFCFCEKEETGQAIVEILKGNTWKT